jgi:RNA polymerase sigma-70 factor (ECF subfamily)
VADIAAELDAIMRRDRSRVIGALLRLCGGLDAAEEAFQDAVVQALATWPERGRPDNPTAWLMTTAKNRARDLRRHDHVVATKAPLLVEADMAPDTLQTVTDDQLRLMFTCCHPDLARDAQVALTLKVIAGFTVEELARAFLVSEATMAQRIVRAKRTIDARQLAYVEPEPAKLHDRIAAVLEVVYLIFNEGHTGHSGELVRLDLHAEALRLGRLLAELAPREADVFGLLAMMAFSAARAATRVDEHGALVLLEDQDRSRWNVALVEEGVHALQRARALGGGGYLAQAEIAACHTTAPTWAATDWARILTYYDELLAETGSPVVALNRAVAVCMIDGAEAGLAALAELEAPLERYHLFFATRADFLRRLGRDARSDYERALSLATNDAERAFLASRLR